MLYFRFIKQPKPVAKANKYKAVCLRGNNNDRGIKTAATTIKTRATTKANSVSTSK